MNSSTTNTEQAYRLKCNFDRFEGYGEGEYDCDAELIKDQSGNSIERRFFLKPEPINIDSGIRLEGFLSDLEGIDYLYTKPSLPIISKRMLYVLKAMGNFSHQEIPVVIEDVEGHEKYRNIRSGKVNHNYVAVHILEHLDIFDRENSIYEPGIFGPNDVWSITKLVLHAPEGGLPPLFKLKVMPGRLFVSPEARLALEESGITGIDFIPKTTK